jgi:orotate phosphoribosyltransferase-like protein
MRHSDYLKAGIMEQQEMMDTAVEELTSVDFDALVGTGISGALAVPLLAYVLNVRFALVRKQGVASHGSSMVEGNLKPGDRWLFVDDFISSGHTKRTVIAAMEDAAKKEYAELPSCFVAKPEMKIDPRTGAGLYERVGTYLYHQHCGPRFIPASGEE